MAIPSPELAALFTPVLEWLDKGGDEWLDFDMRVHISVSRGYLSQEIPRGTVCCIAGALSLFNDLDYSGQHFKRPTLLNKALYAEEVLISDFGMTRDDVRELFYVGANTNPSPQQAAAVIRHWIKTGEVIWPHNQKEPSK